MHVRYECANEIISTYHLLIIYWYASDIYPALHKGLCTNIPLACLECLTTRPCLLNFQMGH